MEWGNIYATPIAVQDLTVDLSDFTFIFRALSTFQAGMINQLAAFRTFLGAVPGTRVRVELGEETWLRVE